jgi:hypothetical protein
VTRQFDKQLRIRGSLPFKVADIIFVTAPIPAMGTTQSPIERIPRVLCPGAKQLRRETYHTSPSTVFVVLCSLKHRKNFISYN